MAPHTRPDRADAYVRQRIDAGCTVALPELRRAEWPDAVYRVRDRHGVDVIAISVGALQPQQVDAIARFQFAQYLAVGFVDADVAYRERMVRLDAPAAAESVQFLVSCSVSGRLLASMMLQALPDAPAGVRLAARERPLFPLEQHFGWGALNRLALLPDTPVGRLREFGRLVRNAKLPSLALGTRVVAELLLAATRALLGPLHTSVDACIGEFEGRGVQRNLEFFHTPMAVLRGGLPAFPAGHPLNPALSGRVRRPFAFWVHDLGCMTDRVDAIEAALEQPDRQAVATLTALKRLPSTAVSSLVPPGGVPSLADLELGQGELTLPARRGARRRGDELRALESFATLSDTEATALATLLVRRHFAPGETVLRRGDRADTLTWIESGEVGTLRAGACIGALGLLANARSPIDLVARTPVSALTLPGAAYPDVVRGLGELELALHRAALVEAVACLTGGSWD
jgi:hypothetical protein